MQASPSREREFILRLPLQNASVEEVTAQVRGALAKDATLGAPEVRRVEFVGPHVGRDLQLQAIYAVLVSMAGILLYIAFRFDVKGGKIKRIREYLNPITAALAMRRPLPQQ